MCEVPTLNESGLPGFDAASWYAVVAPDVLAQFARGEMDRWGKLSRSPAQNSIDRDAA
jgi:tripartite-type tricarboxylate transporter receptor subunit TctC